MKKQKRERPPEEKRKLVKTNEDPVNGVKFDVVDAGNSEQMAALAFRGAKYVDLVVRNSSEARAKRTASEGVWDETRRQVSLAKPKGKSFQVMGWSERSTTWLHPEEALWLVDGGQLLLRNEAGAELPRSWLWERLFCSADLGGLGPQHYSAYQHLRSSGYPARRWSRRAPTPLMSVQDPSSWQRMMENEGGIEDGWIVFEVWPPHEAAAFRRSDPPKPTWRILPWSIDSDCGAAAAWNRVAGQGAMMALSGTAGTRCSFLEVAKFQIGLNPQMKNAILLQAQSEPAEVKRVKTEDAPAAAVLSSSSVAVAEAKWFPTLEEWAAETN